MEKEALQEYLDHIKIAFEQQEARLTEKDKRIQDLLQDVTDESDKSDRYWLAMYATVKKIKSLKSLLNTQLYGKDESELTRLISKARDMAEKADDEIRKIVEYRAWQDRNVMVT